MRALARWGVTPLLAAPLGANALGFGDIELQSALNQPFQAQIALVATADELQGLKVNLAAPEVFERYGIEHPGFLARFEFRITTNGGRSVVQVTSREPVTEPFVTLLVEATWSRGRRLREYTVLLDPPVLLPAPNGAQGVAPSITRPAAPNASGGGAINRPAPPAESTAPAPRPGAPTPPRGEPAPASRPSEAPKSTPTPRALPTSAPGGSYGPVRRAETLWGIAEHIRPEGVSVNQMMVAVYRANPHAFGGNMNVLLAGATLHLPGTDDYEQLSASVATAEVQRQSDEWVNRPTQERTLRLLPPSDTKVSPPAVAPAQAENRAPANAPSSKPASPANGPATANADENRRLLDLRNEQLRNLQEQAAAQAPKPAETPASPPAGAEKPAAPGVELEREQVFADEASKQDNAAQAPADAPAAQAPAPAPAAAAPRPAPSRSLVSQALDWVMSPVLWIGLGVAALLLTALWFVRRRRQEPQDVTGRWEALESEVAEEARSDTERLRRQVPEGSIVVEEGDAPARRGDVEPVGPTEPRRAAAQRTSRAAAPAADETLSSQTVINLDQADPVAEADFHMAYGLYDQAAELVQKALEAAPNRRDLKLKLLEVFFVWGNKDAFLSAAQSLRKEIGQKADPDWDKVVIMGKQICPDERLFAEATSAGGHVDVDLEAGDSPLDLAFDEVGDEAVDLDLGEASLANFDLEPTGEMPGMAKGAATRAAPKPRAKPKAEDLDSVLDIGERTAAGLESAFEELDAEDDGGATLPGVSDSLAVTQESPTIETTARESHDWAKVTIESPTAEYDAADAPTVETPTIESARHDAPTMETPTVETSLRSTSLRSEPPTVEQPAFGAGGGSDLTAEINLDDLGLDVKDLESLPHDLGDLPAAADRETDTREQPEVAGEDDLLSATGVTQVLHDEQGAEVEFDTRKTSVLADDEATMLAPSVRDSTMTGTEVLEHRLELDETGSTSLVRALRTKEKDSLDLNLDDLTQALHGGDTVEQPRTATFSHDVFGGGNTPVDMDIGVDFVGSDDPTGTEDLSPLDPQTMTEVGTKLDLARAYIDMGDPEGARSILEEVLDEGDPNQRREAQGLIDVLTA